MWRIYAGLFRWANLLIIAVTLVLMRWLTIDARFMDRQLPDSLSLPCFIALVAAMVLMAAGGYVVNDIFDEATDLFNKPNKTYIGPHITARTGWRWYIALTATGGAAMIIAVIISHQWWLLVMYALDVFLLYAYSRWLKPIAFLGNLTIAFLCGFGVLIVPLVAAYSPDYVLPEIERGPGEGFIFLFYLGIVLPYAVFSFGTNLIREIIKDIEDIEGDRNAGYRTAPIVLGVKKAKGISLLLNVVLIILTFPSWVIGIVGMIITMPGIVSAYLILKAETKQEFSRASLALKVWMLIGLALLIGIMVYFESI